MSIWLDQFLKDFTIFSMTAKACRFETKADWFANPTSQTGKSLWSLWCKSWGKLKYTSVVFLVGLTKNDWWTCSLWWPPTMQDCKCCDHEAHGKHTIFVLGGLTCKENGAGLSFSLLTLNIQWKMLYLLDTYLVLQWQFQPLSTLLCFLLGHHCSSLLSMLSVLL